MRRASAASLAIVTALAVQAGGCSSSDGLSEAPAGADVATTHIDYEIPDVDELDEEGERGPTSIGPWYFVFDEDPTDTAGARVVSDGPVLQVMVESCQGDPEITEVEETDAEVRVAVDSTTYASFGTEVCRDSVIVELDQPLGDRAVIDLLTGQTMDRQEP